MLPEYRTIYRGGEDEIVEKKSRFIATVVPVNTEEEALEFVEKTRKKYWDARHNCFAYIIGERGQLQRCSDDGEPNGTAGKPMLDVLLGNELRNVAVVVTRYFGGTLLGTGGLVRAYSGAVKAGLDADGIPYKDVELGIMIETPAAVMISDLLAKEVDFFSIGTNDLTQYTLAIDRQNPKLDNIYDSHHEAVLRMLKMVVDNGHKEGCWVGICGELGADETLTETFLRMGFDELSVSPSMILRIRDKIRNTDLSVK